MNIYIYMYTHIHRQINKHTEISKFKNMIYKP